MLPGFWRVVYIPVTPILFDGSLMYNLAYRSLFFQGKAQRRLAWWADQPVMAKPTLSARPALARQACHGRASLSSMPSWLGESSLA